MQRDDALQLVRQMRAPFRLALGERLLLPVIGVRQMIDAREQRAEIAAVGNDAADGNSAETGAVITALAADQARARTLAARMLIGDGDFQRRIARFRARVAKEDMIEIARRQRGDAARQHEGLRMRVLERRRVIEHAGLGADGFDHRLAIMPGVATPKSRGGVEHRAPFGREVVHVLRAGHESRPLLERPVGGEGKPEGFQIVGLQGGTGRHGRLLNSA